jgi:G3E family GTPase
MGERVPVIALTGYLGAGKTTVLNHLLRAPGARVGVVVNDFGAINVDAALVTGQVDEPAAITGGCVCCVPDTDGLDEALEKLTQPRLRLDAVLVEASGVADPPALARLLQFSAVRRARPGGLVDVIDAAAYFDTVDSGGPPPARFAAASLVLINKTDRVPAEVRADTVARIAERVREANPRAHLVDTTRGRVDPALVFDAASPHDPVDELPFAAVARQDDDHGDEQHRHVDAVTVPATGPVDPGALVDLLEDPPVGAYRLKGTVTVDTGRGLRGFVVNVVGRQIDVAAWPGVDGPGGLVAIGMHLDQPAVRARIENALRPPGGRPAADGVRRLARYRRLSA